MPAAPRTAVTGGGGGRVTGLDGLRGLAALTVVVYHGMLAVPLFAAQLLYNPPPLGTWSVFFRTPLHLLAAGTEAVYVFFVLSGYVLTLAARRASFGWAAYYASRTLRLYLPVAGSLVLAYLLWQVYTREPLPVGGSWWLSNHGYTPGLRELADNTTLIGPHTGTWINSALWSLKWEVWFSLLLPLYLVFATSVPRWWRWKVLAALVAVFLGAYLGRHAGTYLPMFAVGAVLAVRDRTPAPPRARGRGVGVPPAALLVVGLLLLPNRWYLVPQYGNPVGLALSTTAATLGAALVVEAVIRSRRLDAALSRPVIRWLGTRSFSLYLVHEPIIVVLGLTLATRWAAWPLVIGLPLALLVAEVFYRLVERPSHRLAAAVGRAVGRHSGGTDVLAFRPAPADDDAPRPAAGDTGTGTGHEGSASGSGGSTAAVPSAASGAPEAPAPGGATVGARHSAAGPAAGRGRVSTR